MGKLIIWCGASPIKLKNAIGTTLWNCGVEYYVKGFDGKIPAMNPGDVVLAMGQKTLDVIQAAGLVPKNRKIGSMRGTELKLHSGKCSMFFTYDPGLIEIDIGRLPDIKWDTQLCLRKIKTGTIDPILGKYKYVTDYSKEIKYINDTYEVSGKVVDISVDLETVGLDPFAEGVFIVSISVTVKQGHAAVIRFKSAEDTLQPAMIKLDVSEPHCNVLNQELLDQLKWLFSTPKVILKGANFKFDIGWIIRHWGIDVYSNYKMDTTLVGSLLDENRSNSLNNHAKIYANTIGGYDDKFNQSQDKSRMDLVSDSNLLSYAGGDTDACLRVSRSMRRDLGKDKALRNFYIKLLHPAAKAVQVMEHRGMVVDVAQYEILRHQVQRKIEETSAEILQHIPNKIKFKYSDNLSPTRATMLNTFLFGTKMQRGLGLKPLMYTAKAGKPSTAMEHLELLAEKYPEQVGPLINSMREYNSATKTMSTYIVGFLKHLRSDGMFHATYHLFKGGYEDKDSVGCLTGRTSATNPAYQCQPARSKILTDSGYMTMGALILSVRGGASHKVLTHTGDWKPVIDTHNNGKHKVYKVTLKSGKVVECTGNHPILTPEGFIMAQYINISDNVFVYHDSLRRGIRNAKVNTTPQTESFYSTGCIDHAIQAIEAGFELDEVVSIELVSEEETYGITIQGDHSYISDGVVVHNTIPKHTIWAKPLRSVYTAPPGMVIMNVDYSQGELRVMACLSNEENMLEAYRKGIDMHLITGASVAGIELEEALAMKKEGDPKIKEIRQSGKGSNFGLIYGISPEGFQVYARKTYGVDLSLDEAYRYKDVFFKDNPKIAEYHDTQRAFAHNHGYVRSPLGRIRHLPLINSRDRSVVSKQERQALNSPCQSVLSDLGLYAIAELHRRYPELWVNGFTHDSITAYVPEDEIDIWAKRMKEVMENLPLKEVFGWDHQIPFTVDVEVGMHNLSELEEYPT